MVLELWALWCADFWLKVVAIIMITTHNVDWDHDDHLGQQASQSIPFFSQTWLYILSFTQSNLLLLPVSASTQ